MINSFFPQHRRQSVSVALAAALEQNFGQKVHLSIASFAPHCRPRTGQGWTTSGMPLTWARSPMTALTSGVQLEGWVCHWRQANLTTCKSPEALDNVQAQLVRARKYITSYRVPAQRLTSALTFCLHCYNKSTLLHYLMPMLRTTSDQDLLTSTSFCNSPFLASEKTVPGVLL